MATGAVARSSAAPARSAGTRSRTMVVARSHGADGLTGKGLDDALAKVDAVIEVTSLHAPVRSVVACEFGGSSGILIREGRGVECTGRNRLGAVLLLLAARLVLPAASSLAGDSEPDLLRRLDGPLDANGMYSVAYELGRLESARGLEKLLATPDERALVGYSHGLSNSETGGRGKPLGDLEDVIVRHFDDPGISLTLVQIVFQRTYNTRALFERFARRLRQPELPALERSQLAYAAARTDLAVEAEMLDLLKRIPPASANPSSVQWTAQTRYAFYGYFTAHPYAPAVPVLRGALKSADPYEVGSICAALAKVGSPEAVAAVVEQVERLRAPGGNPARADQIAQDLMSAVAALPPDAPVDLAVVRRVLPDQASRAMVEAYLGMVGHLGDAAALPDLMRFVASDEPRGVRASALVAILSLDSADAGRAADAELTRLESEGKLSPSPSDPQRRALRERLADPERAIAAERDKRRDAQRGAELATRRRPLEARLPPRSLAASDPERFLAEDAVVLTSLEALVAGYEDTSAADGLRGKICEHYLHLASVARFRLHDARRAVTFYEKAAGAFVRCGPIARFAIADTWEYDLQDAAKSAEAYGTLLAALRSGTGEKGEFPEYRELLEWWSAAVGHEAKFLADGKPFAGRLSRSDAVGIYGAAFVLGYQTSPDLPELDGFDDVSSLADLDRTRVRSALRSLPASHFVLLHTIPLLPLLSPPEIVEYLERQDPGRYWSTSLITTAVLVTAASDGDGSFRLLPKPEELAKIGGNPFPEAARLFAKRTQIELDVAPEERFASPERTWAEFLLALRRGDRRGAFDCASPHMKERLRAIMAGRSDAQLAELAAGFSELAFTSEYGSVREYAVSRKGPGESLAGIVSFVHVLGRWQIHEM